MNSLRPPMVVVGVSGSSASAAAALRWAADEARRRHAALRVVRSWDAYVHGVPVRADVAASEPQSPEQTAAASPARRLELVST